VKRPAAVAYVRVSSRAQDLASQLAAVTQAAAAKGDKLRTIYREKISAKTLDRPQLTQLRTDARAGLVRRLYVFRLDRLTRSGIRDTLATVRELQAAGVELVSIADGFDLQGPASDVVIAVIAWAAQMERTAIGDRVAAGIARLKAQGRTWGRQRSMSPALRSRARAMHAAGKSVRAISIALKVPRSTMARELGAVVTNDAPTKRKATR
jgi:DNA invertase Pin-like site-specific DNA recombinase